MGYRDRIVGLRIVERERVAKYDRRRKVQKKFTHYSVEIFVHGIPEELHTRLNSYVTHSLAQAEEVMRSESQRLALVILDEFLPFAPKAAKEAA